MNDQKCHDSDLESPWYDKVTPGSPRGHFYGLNWSTGRYSIGWGPSIYVTTRGWLTITLRISGRFWGTWFASNSKISIWVPLDRVFFGAFQRSWMCCGPLFTDLRSYERVRRLLRHNGVWFQSFGHNPWIEKISRNDTGNHQTAIVFGAFQRSWMCWGPLFTDLRSYGRVWRLLRHNGVWWSWHFLYSSERECVSKVWPIRQCARA